MSFSNQRAVPKGSLFHMKLKGKITSSTIFSYINDIFRDLQIKYNNRFMLYVILKVALQKF